MRLLSDIPVPDTAARNRSLFIGAGHAKIVTIIAGSSQGRCTRVCWITAYRRCGMGFCSFFREENK